MAKKKATASASAAGAGRLTIFNVPGTNPVERVALAMAAADAIIDAGRGTFRAHIGGQMHHIASGAPLDKLSDGLTVYPVAGSQPPARVALNMAAADAISENGKGVYRVIVGGVSHLIESKESLEEISGGAPLEVDAEAAE